MSRSGQTDKDGGRPPSPGRSEPEQPGMTPLRDVIQALFNGAHRPFNPDDARIWQVWEDVVGPAIARNARPSWIRQGRLTVRVSGPIWLQELDFAREGIREKLNAALGRQAVSRIEFRLGDPGREP